MPLHRFPLILRPSALILPASCFRRRAKALTAALPCENILVGTGRKGRSDPTARAWLKGIAPESAPW